MDYYYDYLNQYSGKTLFDFNSTTITAFKEMLRSINGATNASNEKLLTSVSLPTMMSSGDNKRDDKGKLGRWLTNANGSIVYRTVNRAGFGLGGVQWTFDRRVILINNYYNLDNKSTISQAECIEAEVNFLIHELRTYKGVDRRDGKTYNAYNKWKEDTGGKNSLSNAGIAAEWILRVYEQPQITDEMVSDRMKRAKVFYDQLTK